MAEGTFYQDDLLGCRVVTVFGQDVGPAADILSTGGSDLLVVRPEAGGEVLIPLVGAIVRRVDLEAKIIVIDPPDGLLDLNEI